MMVIQVCHSFDHWNGCQICPRYTKKEIGTPRCSGPTGSRVEVLTKMAMFEVILRASWRTSSDSEAFFELKITKILKFWSQNFSFQLDPWRMWHVPERRILTQFPNKAF